MSSSDPWCLRQARFERPKFDCTGTKSAILSSEQTDMRIFVLKSGLIPNKTEQHNSQCGLKTANDTNKRLILHVQTRHGLTRQSLVKFCHFPIISLLNFSLWHKSGILLPF